VARNEVLLRKTQAREIELLRASSLGELFDRIVSGLRDAYALDFVTLSLFDPQHELRHLSGTKTLSSAVDRGGAVHRCGVAARTQARAIRSALARPLQPATTSCSFRRPAPGQHRADPAAARQPRDRSGGIRQPRSEAIHRAILPRISSRIWRDRAISWKTR
jgi:hypothetical protein